ncbi:S8 family serine peptidase [Flavobacterium sp.]|uniref:S8 family serine peptidase n=1 Tax=Flavobacterium sp. TaxID=239 RepID=UPI001B5E2008|nr:S8 family serine peptidase [Flavobacterium sp.]MBP6126719.1 S8 family peptidase [Flavobacterium sp.]
MKKKLTFLLFTISMVTFAQNHYYYYKGKKQALLLETSKVNVFTNAAFSPSQVAAVSPLPYQQKSSTWGTVVFPETLSEMQLYQKINQLKNTQNISSVGLYYKAKNNKSVGTSNLFYVQLKNPEQYAVLQTEAAQKNVTILRQLANSLWYCLQLTNKSVETSVALSNYFYEAGFANVDPGFILPFANVEMESNSSSTTSNTTTTSCSNDPLFGGQWALNGTTAPNADINACQAWTIGTGTGVKVAVLDNGIKLDHPDLAANIYPLSYNAETLTSPSQLTPHPSYISSQYSNIMSNHGTHVAGIIGAKGNNGIKFSGVAPNCTLMGISHFLQFEGFSINHTERLGYGINWAKLQGAEVINCSWHYDETLNPTTETPFSTTLLESFIIDFIENGREGKGGILVFAAGNTDVAGINYPASFDARILTIGASDTFGQRASFSSYDVVTTSNRTVDVVAPGVNIGSLIVNILPGATIADPSMPSVQAVDPNGSIDQTYSQGTSMAAPHVSGVAALMLSVNPCLTGQQIRDIIEQTAQKVGGYTYATTVDRPNGTWHKEMGYGLLDAHAAVLKAQQMYSSVTDLYVKDNTIDLGIEPNTTTSTLWNSPNIWLRNSPDNGTTHQNAGSGINYVYVKVQNKGCVASNPKDLVRLFQSVYTWGLEDVYSGIIELNQKPIPVLQPGEERIIMMPITPIFNTGHSPLISSASINLIAQIIPFAETTTPVITLGNTLTLAKNHNNIAIKNCVRIFPIFTPTEILATYKSGNIPFGNIQNTNKNYKIELIEDTGNDEKAIYKEAEVDLKMSEEVFQAWTRGGAQQVNMNATSDLKIKRVTNENVILDNVNFNANEFGNISLSFNFLTEEITDKTLYTYNLIMRDKVTNEIVNGATIEIEKPLRASFVADAGDDITKDKAEVITITAEDINEPAIYNWYDSAGNLVFTGKDLTISNAAAQKYKLEVIATADGFKDYTEVEVSLKPSVLSSIAPNPATSAVTIGYKINEGGNAYVMVLGGYGTTATSNNYILDVNQSETTLDVSNYSNGFYTVALVVNGQIVDAKTLIKE